jgi:hypothetical protein
MNKAEKPEWCIHGNLKAHNSDGECQWCKLPPVKDCKHEKTQKWINAGGFNFKNGEYCCECHVEVNVLGIEGNRGFMWERIAKALETAYTAGEANGRKAQMAA